MIYHWHYHHHLPTIDITIILFSPLTTTITATIVYLTDTTTTHMLLTNAYLRYLCYSLYYHHHHHHHPDHLLPALNVTITVDRSSPPQLLVLPCNILSGIETVPSWCSPLCLNTSLYKWYATCMWWW